MRKRVKEGFNNFRYYGVLQERVYFNRNNDLVEDYRNVRVLRCNILGLTAYQKSFNDSINIVSTHKVYTRYFQGVEDVQTNFRIVFPFEKRVYRIESFIDKTSRKEYVEMDVQENVYTTKTTTQPTPPLVFAKFNLTQASFTGTPEEDQLREIAENFENFNQVLLNKDRFVLDNYSFLKDMEFISPVSEPQFLYFLIKKTDCDFLKRDGRLMSPPAPPNSENVVSEHFSPIFNMRDYDCFRVNSNPFTDYLTE